MVVRELAVGLKLRKKVGGALNRACDELRKKGDIGEESHDVTCRFEFLAIDINRVAEGLEGIEGDAYRKDDSEQKTICGDAEELAELGDKEIVVFEDGENGEIEHDIGYHPELSYEQTTAP